MGIVYRARQQRPDRLVALKVIAPELAGDDAFRARFERESQLAASIEHPNVIPIYAAEDEGGVLYIAMRYVEGTDLGELVRGYGGLAPARAVRLIAQVAGALDAAHRAGLVHRDVKPANVLVAHPGPDESAYLTDFGLTRSVRSQSGMTRAGMVVGTYDYMAPEQFKGTGVDARTDVYALGCVLYESLTGVLPFPRDTDAARC